MKRIEKRNNLKPKISVGIPVYNEEKNIKKLLISLINQKGVKIEEIIIVNDGSDDKTLEKIEEIKRSENIKIRLINLNKNTGKSNCLNLIFKHAKSEYLITLDSDIYFEDENMLKCLLENFINNGHQIGLVCGFYEVKILNTLDLIGRAYRFSAQLLEKIATFRKMYGATGAIMAFHRNIFKKLRLPKKIVRCDLYIYLYVISLKKEFVFNPKCKAVLPIYEREKLNKFIKKQFRSTNIPSEHKKRFKHIIKKEKLKYSDLLNLVKIFFIYFVKNPLDGFIWLMLKIIFILYKTIFYRDIEISHLWRQT